MLGIRAAHAFDGDRFLPDGVTVLIDGGRIVGVEPASYDVPADCAVTDYGEATVLPGLIDSHVHLVADGTLDALEKVEGYTAAEIDDVVTASLRAALAGGVTMVRDLGDRGFNVVDRRDAQRQVDDGLPWIVAAGPPITSVGGHCCYLGGEVVGAAGIQTALRERVERRVDVVKVMTSGGVHTAATDVFGTQFTFDELRTLVDGASAAGLPVAAHAHSASAMDMLAQLPVHTIEHASYLRRGEVAYEGLLAMMNCDLSDQQAAALAANGAHVCPTTGSAAPPGGRLPPPVQAQFDAAGVTFDDFRQVRTSLVRRLAEAGVPMVGGMDTGIAPVKAHGLYAVSVIDLATSIGAVESLRASTTTAATICGLGSSKGRLSRGFDADVLVVAGDLSQDLGVLREVREVVLRGTVVSAASSS